jgi:hypothetical protein
MWSVEENTDHGVLLSANTCIGGKAFLLRPQLAK